MPELFADPSIDDFVSSYRTSVGQLIGFFRARGIPRDESADLAHEAILRTLVHLKRHGRERTDLGPLVRTIARNLAVERARKLRPTMVALSEAVDVVDEEIEPFDHVVAGERRAAVRAAISGLSPRHREVVSLWMQGSTPNDIARRFGIKRNAVDAILHRARRALASKLGPRAVWGAVALVFLRARESVRGAGRTIASWSPTSSATSSPAVALATIGLMAVLGVTTPDQGPPPAAVAAPSGHAASERAPSTITVAGNEVSLSSAATRVAGPVDVDEPPYTTSAGATVRNPTTGEDDDAGIDLTYDPNADRGPVDDVLEPIMDQACTSGMCGAE